MLVKPKKWSLSWNICRHEAYPEIIQKRRMTLRPILKLAKTKTEYKGKCKLDYDCLIVKGTRYTVETLSSLPIDLNPI